MASDSLTLKGLLGEIEERNKAFMDAFDRGDAKALSELYTEDCKLMPPGQGLVIGREDVTKAMQATMDSGIASVKLNTDEVGPLDPTGTIAYERGSSTSYFKGTLKKDEGKYVVIWKRLGDGKLYLYTDIFNSNN